LKKENVRVLGFESQKSRRGFHNIGKWFVEELITLAAKRKSGGFYSWC